MSLILPERWVLDDSGLLKPQGVQDNFDQISAAWPAQQFSGSGDPNGNVMASPGAVYTNTAGGAGATLWVKESGANTNTGWVAK